MPSKLKWLLYFLLCVGVLIVGGTAAAPAAVYGSLLIIKLTRGISYPFAVSCFGQALIALGLAIFALIRLRHPWRTVVLSFFLGYSAGLVTYFMSTAPYYDIFK